MTPEQRAQELKVLFKNNTDCYADTWSQDGIGSPMIEGDVIRAMTVDKFIEVVSAYLAGLSDREGMKWVKASEMLPEKSGQENEVIVKGVITDLPYYNNHSFVSMGFKNFDKENPKMYFAVGSRTYLSNDVYWLDESPSTPPVNELLEALEKVSSFDKVLEENWQAQIAGYFNDDKTDLEREKRNAVIEEYNDLIAIFKKYKSIARAAILKHKGE